MRLTETEDYERLVRFFVENELEYDGDEEVDTDILKCFQMTIAIPLSFMSTTVFFLC